MADKKPNTSDRCAEMLFALLDSTSRDLRMPEVRRQATREAVTTWLGQLDDKAVVDMLHKLYWLAERDARERSRGNGGIAARMVRRLNRRFHLGQ